MSYVHPDAAANLPSGLKNGPTYTYTETQIWLESGSQLQTRQGPDTPAFAGGNRDLEDTAGPEDRLAAVVGRIWWGPSQLPVAAGGFGYRIQLLPHLPELGRLSFSFFFFFFLFLLFSFLYLRMDIHALASALNLLTRKEFFNLSHPPAPPAQKRKKKRLEKNNPRNLMWAGFFFFFFFFISNFVMYLVVWTIIHTRKQPNLAI